MLSQIRVPQLLNGIVTNKDTSFVMVLLAISLSINVYLGWQVRTFKANLRTQNAQVFSLGASVPPMIVRTLGNQEETIDYASGTKPTVVYIFAPGCGWCDRNIENVTTLASLKGDAFRFIGISLADANLEMYLESHKLNFPVYKNLSRDCIRDLGLGSTPQTLVVALDGKLLKNWVGAYGDSLKSELESFFAVKLPGVTALEAPAATPGSEKSCARYSRDGYVLALAVSCKHI